VIDARDVFCLYPVPGGATVAALRGLSLQVAAGERVVVHGPNGSGKTTLLRVLTGEVPASAGSIAVSGLELVGASAARVAALRRSHVGLVDQHSGRSLRPELNVRDNVALHLLLAGVRRRVARSAAEDTLAALGLAHLAGRRPQTLSGGEAQRVAVCAAVVHRPDVLLADEPTGELDLVSADAVYDLLSVAAAEAGASLLLVSHDPRAARVADRVVRIRDGRLSEQWSPDDPQDEALVVDARGWVRLPGTARTDTLSTSRGSLRLEGAGARAVEPVPVPPLPGPEATPPAPLLRASGLRLRFGERAIFYGLDLDLAPGALTVVRGRSGAGKSTLLRMLLGLADPDDGTILLGGTEVGPLGRPGRAALRRQMVSVALQAGSLAEPMNAIENLTLARTARGLSDATEGICAIVSALGLDAVADRPVRLLSGGERQRVAIARSLVVRRPLVVLDEPTSQQDEAHAELVTAALVAAVAAGTTVLSTTHDPLLAAAAEKVVEL
jgi:ABC-type lipoprotein export system ATPase subunit